jgi:hypothetical protein
MEAIQTSERVSGVHETAQVSDVGNDVRPRAGLAEPAEPGPHATEQPVRNVFAP